MRGRSAVVGASVTATAAVVGNTLIGREAMRWFKSLNTPRWQLAMPGFVTVALAYYLIVGYVLSRAVDRRDVSSIRWSVTVLIGNEAWNALLFGRRSTGSAFIGLLTFLAPLAALQRSVWRDPPSRWALLPYTAFVIVYDLPWSYRLWRLNPRPARVRGLS